MERVRGPDARYLYMETPAQHMHTMKLAVLEPLTGQPNSFTRLRDHLAERALRLPPLRWRLQPGSCRLLAPRWTDADFDPCSHIHRLAVPSPGGTRELCAVVSRLASRPLHRSQPLWEAWILEGLEEAPVALALKTHHALSDGTASARLLAGLLGESKDGAAPVDAGPVPSFATSARLWPALWRRIATELRGGALRGLAPAAPFTAPPTRFNHRLSPRRRYACVSVNLDDVRAIKTALGCTFHAVVLAAVSGAVRDYLDRRGELPREALTANVPVSLRSADEPWQWGNRLSEIFTSLHTDLIDPVERLRAIHATTQAARRRHDRVDRRLWDAWWECGPLSGGCVRALATLTAALRCRPPCNLIISSVRGPSHPLICAGARLVGLHSLGPIADNVGLNVTAWSYLNQLNFGVVACPERLPDVWELAKRIPEQVAELRRAVG